MTAKFITPDHAITIADIITAAEAWLHTPVGTFAALTIGWLIVSPIIARWL